MFDRVLNSLCYDQMLNITNEIWWSQRIWEDIVAVVVAVVYNAVFTTFKAIWKADTSRAPSQTQAMDLFVWCVCSDKKIFSHLTALSRQKRAIYHTRKFWYRSIVFGRARLSYLAAIHLSFDFERNNSSQKTFFKKYVSKGKKEVISSVIQRCSEKLQKFIRKTPMVNPCNSKIEITWPNLLLETGSVTIYSGDFFQPHPCKTHFFGKIKMIFKPFFVWVVSRFLGRSIGFLLLWKVI